MSHTGKDTNVLNWLLGAAALVVVIAGLRAAQSLVVPFLVAAFLAVICTPALQWLQSKGVPKLLSLLLVMGGVSLLLMVIGLVAGASIQDFLAKLPEYTKKLEQEENRLGPLVNRGVEWLGFDLSSQQQQGLFDSERVVNFFVLFLANLTALFSNAFLVLLTFLFMLLEASGLPRKLLAMSAGRPGLSHQAKRISEAINHYMTLKTILSLLTGFAVATLNKALGVDYPVLWGLLAFFFNFVPNIGSIFAAVPAVLLALIQTDIRTTLMSVAGYLLINVTIGNFLEPRIMGKGLGLSTLVVFLSLVFWGWVLGPVGMLLSVPLTMIMKITLENFEQTRWIAVLLSANPAP